MANLKDIKKGDKVIMRLFTGAFSGVKVVEKTDANYIYFTTGKGLSKFSRKTGKMVDPAPKNEAYANYIEEFDAEVAEEEAAKKEKSRQTKSKKAKEEPKKKVSKKAKPEPEEVEEDEEEEEEAPAPKKKAVKKVAKKKAPKKAVEEDEDDFEEVE